MTVRVDIGAPDLRHWLQVTETRPRQIRQALVRSLNFVGDKVTDQMVEHAAAIAQLPSTAIRRRFVVRRANMSRLTYQVDASRALVEDVAGRPLAGRTFTRRPEGYFQPQELVKIVTMGDEHVCEICEALQADSPYTIEEARKKLPAHLNCRCVVEPFRLRRQLPIEMRRGAAPRIDHTVTVRELADRLRAELRVTLRVR